MKIGENSWVDGRLKREFGISLSEECTDFHFEIL
jgi:hypothetical protein